MNNDKKILEMLQAEVKKHKEGKPQRELSSFDQGFNEGLIYAKQKVALLIHQLANWERDGEKG